MDARHKHLKDDVFSKRPCALLWDESFLWGLMARRALMEAGLPFDLLRSGEVREGALSRYRMIFVPGGWASQKLAALEDRGREEIRRFVAGGGSYLGICGGAGMATEEGLGLLSILRKPTAERVPSFSGPVGLSLTDHAIWRDIEKPVFSAWWPSQFQMKDDNLDVLARYAGAQDEAFSSDINVADGRFMGWSDLEQRYGILLNPDRLRDEPAVAGGRCGRGRVILSLIHFDTPGDRNGCVVLRNLWDVLAPGWRPDSQKPAEVSEGRLLPEVPPEIHKPVKEIHTAVVGLMATGARNFLWYRRNPLLLQWRRGVRGLEYSTLAAMIGEIGECLTRAAVLDGRPAFPAAMDTALLAEDLRGIRDLLIPFAEKAKHLLVRERLYMNTACLSPVDCADREIRSLRQELFGSAMSHGGRFKHLIGAVDRLLFRLIKDAGCRMQDPGYRRLEILNSESPRGKPRGILAQLESKLRRPLR